MSFVTDFPAALLTERCVLGNRLRSNRWIKTWAKRTSRRAQGGGVRMGGWKICAGVWWVRWMIGLTIPIGLLFLSNVAVGQSQLDRLKKSRSFLTPVVETPMVEIPAGAFTMG